MQWIIIRCIISDIFAEIGQINIKFGKILRIDTDFSTFFGEENIRNGFCENTVVIAQCTGRVRVALEGIAQKIIGLNAECLAKRKDCL